MVRLTSRGAGAEAVDPEAAALAGLDNLELPTTGRHPWSARSIWAIVWPKLLAIGLVIGVWQIVHLTGWKQYVLPGPGAVFANCGTRCSTSCSGRPSRSRCAAP